MVLVFLHKNIIDELLYCSWRSRVFPHLPGFLSDTAHALTVLSSHFPVPFCNVWKLMAGYSVFHGKLKLGLHHCIRYVSIPIYYILLFWQSDNKTNTQHAYMHSCREWPQALLNHVSCSDDLLGTVLVLIALCAGWMAYSHCGHLLLAFSSTSQYPAAFYVCLCVWCPLLAHIRTKCSCELHGLNTLDLYRNISMEAKIKSLLESVLSQPGHRSHSVLLIGKLGKVMGREELKIYNLPMDIYRHVEGQWLHYNFPWTNDSFICFVLSEQQSKIYLSTYDTEKHQILTSEMVETTNICNFA